MHESLVVTLYIFRYTAVIDLANAQMITVRVIDTLHDYSFARPLQSYAITLKIPRRLETGSAVDCVVTGPRERSISALDLPVRINSLPAKALESISGVSRSAASDIILKRPLRSADELLNVVPTFSQRILPFVSFD